MLRLFTGFFVFSALAQSPAAFADDSASILLKEPFLTEHTVETPGTDGVSGSIQINRLEDGSGLVWVELEGSYQKAEYDSFYMCAVEGAGDWVGKDGVAIGQIWDRFSLDQDTDTKCRWDLLYQGDKFFASPIEGHDDACSEHCGGMGGFSISDIQFKIPAGGLPTNAASIIEKADKYYWGHGVKRDFAEAAYLYEQACTAGEKLGCAYLSNILFSGLGKAHEDKPRAEQLMKGALPALKEQCEGNSLKACRTLGLAYDRGNGVTQDYKQALALFTKVCEGGNARGCTDVGRTYANDKEGIHDYNQAITFYRRACAGGDATGCGRLGLMYLNGAGIIKDHKQAVTLFSKACDGGDVTGCRLFGLMHSEGRGVTQDDRRAADLYRKACEGGDPTSCRLLGSAYALGKGVSQDFNQAVPFFRKACDGGNAAGCGNLGSAYAKGRGVGADPAYAFALYRKGCEGEDASSCYQVGYMYAHGKGVPTANTSAAQRYFKKACDGGHKTGCDQLPSNSVETRPNQAAGTVGKATVAVPAQKVVNIWLEFKTIGEGDDVKSVVSLATDGTVTRTARLGVADGDMCHFGKGEGDRLIQGLCRDMYGFGTRYEVIVNASHLIIRQQEFGDKTGPWETLESAPRPTGVTFKVVIKD